MGKCLEAKELSEMKMVNDHRARWTLQEKPATGEVLMWVKNEEEGCYDTVAEDLSHAEQCRLEGGRKKG